MAKKIDSVAIDAHTAIHGEKRKAYGPVNESFHKIATIASIGCNKEITDEDVCRILLAVKYVRESYNHQRDNLVDICGYADLLQQLFESPYSD